MVEVVVTAAGEPGPDVQVLSERAGLPGTITLDGATVRSMLGLIQGARIDNDTYITDVSMAEDDTGLDITIVIGTEATSRGARRGDQAGAVHQAHRPPGHRGPGDPRSAALPPDAGPAGRGARVRLGPVRAGTPGPSGAASRCPRRAPSSRTVWSAWPSTPPTGRSRSTASPGSGGWSTAETTATPTTTRRRRPTPWCRSPDSVTVAVGERGPVRATVTITSTFTWPDRVDGTTRSRVGGHQVPVETTLEVRADESAAPGANQLRQPVERPPPAGPPPAARAGDDVPCRMRLHRRRPRPGGRGEGRGDRDPHLPVPPVRVQRGPDRGPRGPARVRTGRRRARPRRGQGHRIGPHPVARHRHAVADGHDHPADDRRADDAPGGATDDRAAGRQLRPRSSATSIPTDWPTTSSSRWWPPVRSVGAGVPNAAPS